jgi:hypothetical protein
MASKILETPYLWHSAKIQAFKLQAGKNMAQTPVICALQLVTFIMGRACPLGH